jgi:hypothetical protein
MLVSRDFSPPEKLDCGDFIIRKIYAKDVYLDYTAVMSSINIIKKVRGGSWPTKELTIEDDLIDLCWHQREFEFKNSFAFTVMNNDETKCLGCIYFYPPRTGMSSARSDDQAEVNISMWVIQEEYDKGLYPKLFKTVKEWVTKDWPFHKVAYVNKEIPE